MEKRIIVAPSILSADFSEINKALVSVEECGCRWVHLDVMDGNFVPNITFGPKFIKDIRKNTELFFDTHLMISKPSRYIKQFAEAGSNSITVHYEACDNLDETLCEIRNSGCLAGVSICPETDVKLLDKYLDKVDLILVMTVHPGFGGQKFIEECVEKISYLNSKRGNNKFLISVDGGINDKTAQIVAEAGVDVAVAGSAFFGASDRKEFVKNLENGKFTDFQPSNFN